MRNITNLGVSRNTLETATMTDTFIKYCLSNYVKIIWLFEKNLMLKYDLGDNPYQCQNLFPRRAMLKCDSGDFYYRFHGRGCSFNYLDYEVHYDYYITKADYITTVPWKFWRFVVTQSKKNGFRELTQDDVALELEKLNEIGIIQKVHPDYLEYQIIFSWVKSCSDKLYYG